RSVSTKPGDLQAVLGAVHRGAAGPLQPRLGGEAEDVGGGRTALAAVPGNEVREASWGSRDSDSTALRDLPHGTPRMTRVGHQRGDGDDPGPGRNDPERESGVP